MNKYLLIAGFVAVVAGVAYVVSADKSPNLKAQSTLPTPTPEAVTSADAPIANVPKEVAEVTHAVAHSAGESQSSITSITVEQTQNAVDFNAPGAGTAEQKAGAAAAANKAYQEAKQGQ